jgi:hypothetical protein
MEELCEAFQAASVNATYVVIEVPVNHSTNYLKQIGARKLKGYTAVDSILYLWAITDASLINRMKQDGYKIHELVSNA